MNGLRNPKSRNDILETLDEEIRADKVLKAHVEKMIDSPETYRFISKLLSRSPKIVVVIDELNQEVKEACESLKYETQFVEFKTFVREDAENVHAHLFEPIYSVVTPKVTLKKPFVGAKMTELKRGEVKTGDVLEIKITTMSFRKYALFRIPKDCRRFFPGYKVEFNLETDIGMVKTKVSGGRADMQIGDPDGGEYIAGGLKKWYNKHPELTVGRKVRFECIEPYRTYKLAIV